VARRAMRRENLLAGYRIAGGEYARRAADNAHQHENCFARGEFHVVHLVVSIAVHAQAVCTSQSPGRHKLALLASR